MVRIVLTVIFVAVVLAVVAAVDCALSSRGEVRTLPKFLWILIVLLAPVLGPILWFVFGHPRAGRNSNEASSSPAAPKTPDSDPVFLRGLDSAARVRLLEEELARLEDEDRRDSSGDNGADGRGKA